MVTPIIRPELERLRRDAETHMAIHVTAGEGPPGGKPPGILAIGEHILRVLDRIERGQAVRREVEAIIAAVVDLGPYYESVSGYDPYAAKRQGWVEAWERVAAHLPETLEPRSALHERLRQARRWSGLTVNEVANAVGVDKSTVSRWDHGKLVPSYRHRQALAALYGRPLHDFED